jgi:hypothetical protein
MKPPPLPSRQVVYVERAPRRRTGCLTWLVAIVSVPVLLAVIASIYKAALGESGSPAAAASPAMLTPRQEAQQSLEIVDWRFRTTAGGSIMEADFKIRNKGTKAFKDIEIQCLHYAPSGTQIDQNTRTIYEVIQPGQTREFKAFNMGFIHSQAKRSSATIRNGVPLD